jgi:hypothetical protein
MRETLVCGTHFHSPVVTARRHVQIIVAGVLKTMFSDPAMTITHFHHR